MRPPDSTAAVSRRARRSIEIIGVPIDLGQRQRGLDMGPSAIRYAELAMRLERLGHQVIDTGNVAVPSAVTTPEADRVTTIVRVCETAADRVAAALQRGHIPLSLGGDHSIAIGTIAGSTESRRRGVLWIDAHGDFNTPETSPSGNIHGMPLAALRGQGDPRLVDLRRIGPKIPASDVAIVGLRQLDPRERLRLRESGMALFTMRDVDERGIARISDEALARLSHLDSLHVSLDMDALDPEHAPGVGTPVPGGLTYREAHLLMERVADSGVLASMDVVEVNPALDIRNQTAALAVELIVSAFGQSIL